MFDISLKNSDSGGRERQDCREGHETVKSVTFPRIGVVIVKGPSAGAGAVRLEPVWVWRFGITEDGQTPKLPQSKMVFLVQEQTSGQHSTSHCQCQVGGDSGGTGMFPGKLVCSHNLMFLLEAR